MHELCAHVSRGFRLVTSVVIARTTYISMQGIAANDATLLWYSC